MTKLLTLADFENLYLLRHYELIDREEFRRLHELNVRPAPEKQDSPYRFALQLNVSEDAK